MPTLDTRQFGPIDYSVESTLEFPCGMPAFERHTRFLLIEKDTYAPFLFLQSVIDGQISFLVLPVTRIDPAYQLALEPEEMELLGMAVESECAFNSCTDGARVQSTSPLLTLVVVTLVPGGAPTANLVAPILIHMGNRKGLQSIQSVSGYSHQTLLPVGEGQC